MKILVIAAHPDDEVLGCGGVIARHAAQGDEVHVLVATRGIPEIFAPEFIEEIRRELKAAHQILKVNETHFLDFPAPKLDVVPGHELADGIRKVIYNLRPETIYLPHGGDIHLDHRAVYMATLVAARPSNDCPVKQLLCYETLSETEWAPSAVQSAFIPTVFVDITDFLDIKLQAMTCYRTQLKEPPHSRSLETIKALATLRGATAGFFAAEAFALERQIIS
jgi:LmbE family N-acetylglucosaminyl deacetylase